MIKLLHIMIRVKDIDKALEFYTKLFNMKFDRKKRLSDCELYFLKDESKSIELELTYNDETPHNGYECGTCFGHLAFSCESLDEFGKKLHSAGYDYLYKPFDFNGKGSKIAFIKDPDGNEIELIEKIVW